jgi:hypothetical protein
VAHARDRSSRTKARPHAKDEASTRVEIVHDPDALRADRDGNGLAPALKRVHRGTPQQPTPEEHAARVAQWT